MTMKRKASVIFPVLVLTLLAVCLVSLAFGPTSLTLREIIGGLLRTDGYEVSAIIMHSIRLPRLLAAILAGAGLSVSGVILQNVMGNDLASPNTVGVNAGAGLAVIIAISISTAAVRFLPFIAFGGAFLTLGLIFAVSGSIGGGKSTVILAGIACTTFFQAGISLFSVIDSDVLTMYNAFSVGSFSGVTYDTLTIPFFLVILSLLLGICMSGAISALSLGDKVASGLGVKVKTARALSLAVAGLSAASVISYAGLLGFVGLVVPHITRKLVGGETRRLLIASPIVGAIIVTLSDLLGRVLFAPSELPVGVVMAFIGAPFFFILLIRRRSYA